MTHNESDKNVSSRKGIQRKLSVIYKEIQKKLLDAMRCILPVTLIVVFTFFYVPMPLDIAVKFIVGAIFLVIGTTFFTLGADIAMMSMGEAVGHTIARKNKLGLLALMGLILGFIITITEPGLQVLAVLVADIPSWVLIAAVALGVGIFLAIAFLREVLHINMKFILLGFYTVIFILAFFVPENFLSLAFDSGGATTGAMTVPFIIALGAGIASSQKGNASKDDNFGLIAICSIGPILTVMVLGLIYTPSSSEVTLPALYALDDTAVLWSMYIGALPAYLLETMIALAPIVIFFILFQLISAKLPAKKIARIFVGILYTFIGLVLFLTGANRGFLPAGNLLGQHLANSESAWLLIIMGMIFGFFIITAEPAVYVLNKQVSAITNGAISQKAMGAALSIGVSLSIGISMLRVITGLPILWILLPSYVLSVGLSFVVPKIFTSIAFDSGGVASGPLTSAFLLPLAIGASNAIGGNVATDAFGLIAMVAMTPLITVQVMGLYVTIKDKMKAKKERIKKGGA